MPIRRDPHSGGRNLKLDERAQVHSCGRLPPVLIYFEVRMNGDKGLGSCRKGRHIASSHDLAVLEGTHEVAEISKTLEERPRREPNWQRNIFDNVSTASKRESNHFEKQELSSRSKIKESRSQAHRTRLIYSDSYITRPF